jgi:hypothetical protein
VNGLVVETHFDRGLDHGKVWRNVKVARAIKRAVSNAIDFPSRLCAFDVFDRRQYRIADGSESLRDERRADEFGRITGAQRDHAAPEALRYGQRHQIAAKIDDILQVVLQPDALARVVADGLTVFWRQTNRTADARMVVKIRG